MMWSESTIILAIVGMVGLFSTAIIWQRSNRITSRYYGTRISTVSQIKSGESEANS